MQSTVKSTNCYRTLRSERHSSASAREPKVYSRRYWGISSLFAIFLILSVETIFCPVGFAQPSYTQSTISLPTTGTTYGYQVDFSGNVYLMHSNGSTNEILMGPVIWTPIITGLASPYESFVVDLSGNIFIGDGPLIYEETPSPSGSGYVQSVLYDFSQLGTFGVVDLAVDTSGNLFVSAQAFQNVGQNREYGAILKMTPTPGGSPVVTVIVGAPNFFPYGVSADGNGNVFSYDGTYVYEWSPSGSGYVESIVMAPILNNYGGYTGPETAVADTAGNLFISVTEGGYPPAPIQKWVQEVASPSGYTQVPLDLPGLAGTFAVLAVDVSDNLYTTVNSSGHIVSLLEEVVNPSAGLPYAPNITLGCVRRVGDASLVTIYDADHARGATTYYTTDGTTPSTSSTMVTYRPGPLGGPIPFAISQTSTIKAIAVLNGVSSPVAVRTFTPPAASCNLHGL